MHKYCFVIFYILCSCTAIAQDSNEKSTNLCLNDSSSVLLMPLEKVIISGTLTKSPITGGSITAVSASLGASLMIMTFQISLRLEKDSTKRDQIRIIIGELTKELKEISCAIDADKELYMQFLTARKLPAATTREKAYKDSCIYISLKNASELPLTTARHIDAIFKLVSSSGKISSPVVSSDLNAATLQLSASQESLLGFVSYNASDLNKTDSNRMLAECKSLLQSSKVYVSNIISSPRK